MNGRYSCVRILVPVAVFVAFVTSAVLIAGAQSGWRKLLGRPSHTARRKTSAPERGLRKDGVAVHDVHETMREAAAREKIAEATAREKAAQERAAKEKIKREAAERAEAIARAEAVRERVVMVLLSLVIMSFLIWKCKPAKPRNEHLEHLLRPDQEADLDPTYLELQRACLGMAIENELGRGGFGIVFIGEWCGRDVAIKRLHWRYDHAPEVRQELVEELQIQSGCLHENILPIIQTCWQPLCLVYPYMRGGSLRDCIGRNPPNFSCGHRCRFALAISKGLEYLHSEDDKQMIVHRDLKSTNILLDDYDVTKCSPRIGDIGLAKRMHLATPGYICPWYAQVGQILPAYDVYSLGVIFFELFTGLPAYVSIDEIPLLTDRLQQFQECNVIKLAAVSWEQPELFVYLSFECTRHTPSTRPSSATVVESLWRMRQEPKQDPSERKCNLCLGHLRSTRLLPCQHAGLCAGCVRKMCGQHRSRLLCPVCHQEVFNCEEKRRL